MPRGWHTLSWSIIVPVLSLCAVTLPHTDAVSLLSGLDWRWSVLSLFLATTSLFVATCLPFSHVHLVSPPGHLIPSHCSLLFTLHPKSLHVFPWSVRSFSAVIKAFHNAFHCYWHLLHTLHVLAAFIPSTFLHTYIFVVLCSFCIVCVSHMYASIELVFFLTLCPWIILLSLSAPSYNWTHLGGCLRACFVLLVNCFISSSNFLIV